MSLQSLTDEALVRLRAAGTDLADVEAKRAQGGVPKSLPESLSAFSNGTGGLILLGLDEENGFKPVPIDVKALAEAVSGYCRDAIEPAIQPEIDIVQVDRMPVVAASIPAGDRLRMPYHVKTQGLERGSYLRNHDGDRHLTSYEVHALVAGRGQPRDDMAVVPGATLDDLDPDLVAALVRRLKETRSAVFARASDTDMLRFVQVLGRDRSTDAVTLAGLLTLGRYPQQFFPQLDVTFAAFPTPEPGRPMADGTRFLDNVSLDGPIPLMIQEALAVLRRNMTRRAVVQGIGRQDHWEYPEEVVRELLGNAVMHRDYHPLTHGSQIRIELYPDRLEVISPGGLYGDVPAGALLHEAVSSSRNAALAKLLEDVTYPGTTETVCENRGTGLLAVSHLIRRAGMAQPVVTSRITEFRVTLLSPAAAAPTQPLSSEAAQALSGRQRQILDLLGEGAQTTAQLAAATGVTVTTIRRQIQNLAAAGLVAPTEASKRSPNNAWRLR
ncbi:MAG: putative DNA binding domain-containing protein [Propionibacteriaceae bacterium]|jgi:ATP-dependent DNA helicase RecG|nr:putative DNA binding domain-containing protein [Propionibacteriaceae bacterium]